LQVQDINVPGGNTAIVCDRETLTFIDSSLC